MYFCFIFDFLETPVDKNREYIIINALKWQPVDISNTRSFTRQLCNIEKGQDGLKIMTKRLKRIAIVFAYFVRLAHGDPDNIEVSHQPMIRSSIDAIETGDFDERSLELQYDNNSNNDISNIFLPENVFEEEHLENQYSNPQSQITSLSCPDIGSSRRLMDINLVPKEEETISFTYNVETNSTAMKGVEDSILSQLGSLFVTTILDKHCAGKGTNSPVVEKGRFVVIKVYSAPKDYAIKECSPEQRLSKSCTHFQGFVTVAFMAIGDTLSLEFLNMKIRNTIEHGMEDGNYPEIVNMRLNDTGVEVTSVKYIEGLLETKPGAVAKNEKNSSKITRTGKFLISIFVLTFFFFVVILIFLGMGFTFNGFSIKRARRAVLPMAEERSCGGDDIHTGKPPKYGKFGGHHSQTMNVHVCQSASCQACSNKSKPISNITKERKNGVGLDSTQYMPVDLKRARHLSELYRLSEQHIRKPPDAIDLIKDRYRDELLRLSQNHIRESSGLTQTTQNSKKEASPGKSSQKMNLNQNQNYCHEGPIELVFKSRAPPSRWHRLGKLPLIKLLVPSRVTHPS